MNGTMSIEPIKLGVTEAVSVGETAADIEIKGRTFIIQNTHATQILYFKEKRGTAVTSSTGLKVAAGATFAHILTADTLSIIGSGATTTGIIVYLE